MRRCGADEVGSAERLGEDVCNVVLGRAFHDADCPVLHGLAYEGVVDAYPLGFAAYSAAIRAVEGGLGVRE